MHFRVCSLQYASVAIWMYEDYYTYSSMVLAITLASIITNTVSQYQVSNADVSPWPLFVI